MMLATLVWGTPDWLLPASLTVGAILALVVWSYWRSTMKLPRKLLAGTLKVIALAALAACLLEPLFSGVRPRPGANLFILMADDSLSLRVHDPDSRESRGDRLKSALVSDTSWRTRLDTDFDVRRYAYDRRARPSDDFQDLEFIGTGSALFSSLDSIARRFQGRPNAGILLFTDGRATDTLDALGDSTQLPPIYPVILGGERELRDIRVSRVAVTQTNFEAAPVTIAAEVMTSGLASESLVIQLLDESDKELQRATLQSGSDQRPLAHRFLFRPDTAGISFYKVRAFAAADEKHLTQPERRMSEATWENNSRWAVVDRGGGPYRVLYVTGRPNWEFKFLRRALQQDDEVHLVGLVRIAKKEPKFTFRGRTGETTNPLYRGFGNQDDEQAEKYDQPVLLRLGTEDAEELRDGFPQAAEELFRYHAIVLDDIEAASFTQDQMSLIQEFTSQRGGGFLMLGGRESFAGGGYARTPIGELLPVYVDAPGEPTVEKYSLSLTREGWLQPWIRVRATEPAERQRLNEMPGFKTVNRVRSIKPGASVLAQVQGEGDEPYPAIVAQRFGRGQAAAVLIGDMWRWGLHRTEGQESDLEKAWRQTIRWLVADVPGRVQIETRRKADDPMSPIELVVHVRDEKFRPLDNATVEVRVMTPEAKEIKLAAEASHDKAGTYVALFTSRLTGPYHAEIIVTAEDGSEIGRREAGWVSEPSTEEFEHLTPHRELLEDLARRTEGEVLELHELDDFVSSLPNRKIPVTQPWIYPIWHHWSVFAIAIGCLIGEWGVRRWHGLP